MNRHFSVPRPQADSWFSYFSNALVWLLFAAAGLLLMWFVAVLNDVTQRGEQRRLQQRTTGSLILADELHKREQTRAASVLAASADTSTLR